MQEQMRVAMAHLAHTASELSGDMNAGYIDYDEVDDRRGCRPVDSSDSEPEDVCDVSRESGLVSLMSASHLVWPSHHDTQSQLMHVLPSSFDAGY